LKKICFKLGEFPNVSETFIVNQIQYAIDLGHPVCITVGKINVDNFKFFDSFFNQKEVEINVINYKIPNSKILRLFKWILLLLYNFFRLKEIIAFYKYSESFSLSHLYKWNFYKMMVTECDIVHVQFGTKMHPMDFFRSYYAFKLIVSFHGHDAFFPINGFIKQQGYYDLLFKVIDVVNTNTQYLTNQLIKIGCPEHLIKEIPVAVDVNLFNNQNLDTQNGTLRLLNVGRLHPIKGQSFLIKLMSKVKENKQNINLTIVGTGELKEEYDKLVEDKQLSSYVKLIGAKSQDELKDIYKINDIFLFSSVPINNREETQGLVSIEAQSSSLPIIAFNSGGIKYTFKNNESGFLCDIYDIDEMYKKICFFYENRDQILKFGSNGRQFVEKNFSSQIIKNKWKYIYNNNS